MNDQRPVLHYSKICCSDCGSCFEASGPNADASVRSALASHERKHQVAVRAV